MNGRVKLLFQTGIASVDNVLLSNLSLSLYISGISRLYIGYLRRHQQLHRGSAMDQDILTRESEFMNHDEKSGNETDQTKNYMTVKNPTLTARTRNYHIGIGLFHRECIGTSIIG